MGRCGLFAVAETKSVVEKSSRHVWECQVKSGIRTRNSSLRSPATSLDDERSEQKFWVDKKLLKNTKSKHNDQASFDFRLQLPFLFPIEKNLFGFFGFSLSKLRT